MRRCARSFLKRKDFTHENKRPHVIQINDGTIFRHLVLPKTYKRGLLGQDSSVKRRPFCSAIVLSALPPRADSEPNKTISKSSIFAATRSPFSVCAARSFSFNRAGAACPGGNGPRAWSGLLCSRYHDARPVSPNGCRNALPEEGNGEPLHF